MTAATSARLVAALGRRPVQAQRVAGWVVIVGLFGFGAYSLTQMGFTAAMFNRAGQNVQRVFAGMTYDAARPVYVADDGIVHFFAISFPSASDLTYLIGLTVGVVILGTAIAALVSVPVAYIAAGNTTPARWLQWVGRAIGVVTRAIPDVVIAIAIALFFAIGATLPGIIAIGIHSIGMISKLMADAIEQIDEGPRIAIRAAGGSKPQEFWSGVFPQVLPSWIATTLHRFDINLRGSVILGYAGVGGLGYRMRNEFEHFDFGAGIGIAIVVFVLCVVLEIVSSTIRRSLLGVQPTGRGLGDSIVRRATRGRSPRPAAAAPTVDGSLRRPWTRTRVRNTVWVWSAVAIVVASVYFAQVDFSGVFWRQVIPSFLSFFPPSFGTYTPDVFFEALLETVEIAFAAALITFVFSLVFGSLAARNVAPNMAVRNTFRVILVIIRGIPELVLAIFLIAVTGLGNQPGVIALAFGGIGLLGKLIADSFEEVPRGPETALTAAGATRGQRYVSATLPQGVPSLIGNSLYLVDTNLRAASILGIIGAGGVGYYLTVAAGDTSLHSEVTTIVIMLFVVVLAIEGIATWLRRVFR